MNISVRYSWLLALSLSLSVVGWFLIQCGNDRACSAFYFIRMYLVSALAPVTIFSLCSIPLGVAVLFTTQANIRSISSYARWWVPLSIVLIFLAPDSSGSFFTGFPMDRNMASWILGALFSIIGLTLAFRKSKSA